MNSMRSNNVWIDLIGGLAQELILEIFSDKKQDNKPTPVQEEIEDLDEWWKALFLLLYSSNIMHWIKNEISDN